MFGINILKIKILKINEFFKKRKYRVCDKVDETSMDRCINYLPTPPSSPKLISCELNKLPKNGWIHGCILCSKPTSCMMDYNKDKVIICPQCNLLPNDLKINYVSNLLERIKYY